MSLMLRDTTGLAVIPMLDYKSSKCSAPVFNGPLILEASVKFNGVEIEGAQSMAQLLIFVMFALRKWALKVSGVSRLLFRQHRLKSFSSSFPAVPR